MNIKRTCVNLSAFLAVGGLVAAPLTAFADHGDKGEGHGKGHGNGKSNGHGNGNGNGHGNGNWNPAPPKKNGRHDNRNWNKGDRNDDQGNGRYRSGNNGYNNNGYNNNGYNNQQALANESARRAQTKNEWRNIAIAGGAVTVLGLLQHDNRLVFAGAAGGLYALWRYEEDRKSQSQIDRLRASYFGRPYFVRNGTRFDRRIVTKNGNRYYQFVRG
jgi:hypothetical protein